MGLSFWSYSKPSLTHNPNHVTTKPAETEQTHTYLQTQFTYIGNQRQLNVRQLQNRTHPLFLLKSHKVAQLHQQMDPNFATFRRKVSVKLSILTFKHHEEKSREMVEVSPSQHVVMPTFSYFMAYTWRLQLQKWRWPWIVVILCCHEHGFCDFLAFVVRS
ncbi:hypothetical protein KC19_VG275400 [Ceratodon purpureus]|uniref:Uncharacterized protein n=1 Tax=Ceratodon purpureus TaxID=3225 RepID=A0A8T0HV32_CERPU|nr:hypothetical protein KC19_VG275400 [Ceratodon purpureus]